MAQDRYDIPPDIPRWATQDEVDPVWETDSVIVPAPEERTGGFQPAQPVFYNYINYFFRRNYQWIGHLNGWRGQITVPSGTTSHAITVTGVAPGDSVIATVNQLDSNNIQLLSADVTNTDTVTFTFSGSTGTNPDLTLSYQIWSNQQDNSLT